MANEIELKGVIRGGLPSFLKEGGRYNFAPVETAPNKNFRNTVEVLSTKDYPWVQVKHIHRTDVTEESHEREVPIVWVNMDLIVEVSPA